MSAIKIDKGVPIPKIIGSGRKPKYPANKMEIGDSFFCNEGNETLLQRMAGSFNSQYKPKRFISRRENDGVRIWRVK